jgi:primosomal replication protein N
VADNRLVLLAKLKSREELRRTPAGVPVLSFRVEHESEQMEAGSPRRTAFELDCVLVGAQAERMRAAPGERLKLTGFLTARSRLSRLLVFHVNEFEPN